MKKRNATLIELLIGLTLASLLMTILLGYYWQMTKANREIDKMRQEAFTLRYAYQRIVYALSHASKSDKISPIKEKKPIVCFYTTEEPADMIEATSLVFTFDNGPDIMPEFSNGVLARLYLDRESTVHLAIWPIAYQGIESDYSLFRDEVLLHDVEHMWFEFYSPDTPQSRELKIVTEDIDVGRDETQPEGGKWYRTQGESFEKVRGWNKAFTVLPALVRVHIKIKDHEEEFIFASSLPNCETGIVYR